MINFYFPWNNGYWIKTLRILPAFLLLLVPALVMAQHTIKGKVTDGKGEPLPGVSILVKGAKTGVATLQNGEYSISVPDDRGSLKFSYIGFITQEKAYTDKTTTLNVVLSDDARSLNEVIVTGYGTQRKSDITGSVSGIKAEELTRTKTNDVLSGIQGKISGVQVASQSAEPGSGTNITIRGASTVFGSSSPLFVIDGVQMDINQNEMASSSRGSTSTSDPLASLNPNDIESIEVLKDASATAIYGSRGANGVIIVTTKSGKEGQAKIDYDGYISVGNAAKKVDVLSGDDYLNYVRSVNPTSGVVMADTNGDGTPDTPRDFSTIKKHNWQDEAYRTTISQNQNVSISAGNKTTKFSGGMGYLDQEGLIKDNSQKRYTMRLRVDYTHKEKLKLGLNLNTSYTDLNGATGNGGGAPGVFDGVIQQIIQSRPVEVFDPLNDYGGQYISPISSLANSYKNTNLYKTLLSSYADYEFIKGLNYRVTASGDLSNSKGKEFYGKLSYLGTIPGGIGILQNINSNNYTITNQVTYNKQFNAHNNLNALVAYEISSYNFESDGFSTSNFSDESTGVNNIAKGSILADDNSFKYKNNRISYLGRVNYNLYDRYLFTASLRADGSDKFGPGNRWGYFPSAAFAWQVAEEPFMKQQTVVSNLKARLSYGVTGNERIPPYSYFANYDIAPYSSNDATILGLAPVTKANPDLKWEKTIQYNAGVDFGLLQNKIEVTADYYFKDTKDMLLPVIIPSQTGFRQQYQNRGRITNQGLELSLHSHNINHKNLKWDTDFNISFNKNEIKDLGGTNSIPVNIAVSDITNVGIVQVGQPIGAIYGYTFDGVYQISDFTWQNNSDPTIPHNSRTYTLKPGIVSVSGVTVAPGSFKLRDLNGDGVVNDFDRQVIGHSLPKSFGGFNNYIRYKNFDLNIFTEWSYGRDILDLAKYRLSGYLTNNISTDIYQNRWTPTNPTNQYGALVQFGPLANTTSLLNSSYYVENGSYLRLKSVTLGYHITSALIKKAGFTNLRFYVTGNNLATWTKYPGVDPDVNYSNNLISGLDRGSYPRSRTFILGANLSF